MRMYAVQLADGRVKDKTYRNLGHAKNGARLHDGAVVLEYEAYPIIRYTPQEVGQDWIRTVLLEEKLDLLK